jgi:hypothetical protein
VQSLTRALSLSGTLLCEFFLELPSRVEYPDYYKVIEQPISIEEIEQKLNSKKYRNPHAMFSDLSLMVDNALRYNEDGSPVHTDAVNLRVGGAAPRPGRRY